MRYALLLLMLLSLPATASAKWGYVPLEELVRESDIIVAGTLRDVREHTADAVDYGEGRVVVREVVWGNVSPGDSLTLRWSNPSGVACPRVEHRHSADEEGLWLLTRDGEAVRADYPGRFVQLSKRQLVEAALRDSPVVLRADKYWVEAGEPMKFAVVYRDVDYAGRVFPGLAYEGQRPRFNTDARLTVKVHEGGEERSVRLAGRYASESVIGPYIVIPHDDFRVEFDLREMLADAPREGQSYTLTLKLPGLLPTNEIGFGVSAESAARFKKPAPAASPRREINVFVGSAERRGLSPLVRAELAALAALVFFPLFYRLRTNLADARLARVLHGA
jgi:hypothetical protein